MCTSNSDRKMLTCCQSPGGATPSWPGPAYITLPSAGARTRSFSTCRWSGVRSGSRKNAATPAGRASSDRALRRCPVRAASTAGTALAATNGTAARSTAPLLEGGKEGMGPQPRVRGRPGLRQESPAWRLAGSDRIANTCSNRFTDRSGVSFVADQLVIRGAREHNLKDVSLDLPRDSLIVFTGLSGSGKSSLAFDTIFAEGQRRYVESLSAYARQFLGQMDKPDVDFIEGLSPAVSIDQKSTSKNPRSTVGTITEVYDYLRLLYARAGRPHCPECGAPDRAPDAAADRRPGAPARRGHPLPGARAGDPRPQGRIHRALPQPPVPGLQPGPRRRRDDPARRAAQAGEAEEAHHRGGRRPALRQGVVQASAHRLRRDRAQPRLRPRRLRPRRRATRRTRTRR